MIITIFLIGLGFLGFKYYRFNYGDNKSISYGKTAKLKWSDVKSFYYLNPLRWRYEPIIENDCSTIKTSYKALIYNPGVQWTKNYYDWYYRESTHLVRIRLSFIDYLKFLWCSKHKNPKNIEGIKAVLQCAQGDINRLRKQSNVEMDEANIRMEKIKEELKKGVTLEV